MRKIWVLIIKYIFHISSKQFLYYFSILVHNVQTGEVNRFVADQWLAIDRGTFEDDITVPASGIHDNVESDYLVKAGRGRQLSGINWLSSFTKLLAQVDIFL